MGFFKRTGKVFRMGKQLAELRDTYPQAWAAGEEAADEALRTRSDDLVQMLVEGPEERVEDYRSRMTAGVMEGIGTGELEAPFEVTGEKALSAFGISMGMKILDVVGSERKSGRRRV